MKVMFRLYKLVNIVLLSVYQFIHSYCAHYAKSQTFYGKVIPNIETLKVRVTLHLILIRNRS